MTNEAPTQDAAAAEKPAESKPAPTRDQKLAEAIAKNEKKLDDAQEELDEEKRSVVSLSSQLKDAKERYKGVSSRIHELLYWRRELRKGRMPRQMELPLRTDEEGQEEAATGPAAESAPKMPAAADPADTAPLATLKDFGLTDKQIETLLESQLAKEVPLHTVGDLFRAINKDEWWFKKIKGFGDTKRDALINATIDYREKFPVPDGDTRKKQCKDCDELYAQAGTQCPKCGSKFFHLVTPEEAAPADPNPEEQEVTF